MALKMIGQALPRLGARLRPPPKLPDPFYQSPEWRAFSSAIKSQRGYRCEDAACKAPDLSERKWMLIADHDVERKDGGADFDPLNIKLRCQACHNRKTAAEKMRRQRQGGD